MPSTPSNNSLKAQTAARIQRTEAYAEKIRRMFAETVNEILAVKLTRPDPSKGIMYSFDGDTERVRANVEKLLRRLQAAAAAAIRTGVSVEWGKAEKACDQLVRGMYTAKQLSAPMMKGWNARNGTAQKAFIERSVGGMNLSDRVWQSCRQLRDQLEVAITVGVGEGLDAGNLSRRIRQYLNDPDLMFRRFRYKDADGNWQRKWKKRIADPDRPGHYKFIDYDKDAYHDQWTGRGYYKSSAMNAMRVARTETNIAYRRADASRWREMDFVLGIRIKTSRSHEAAMQRCGAKDGKDICDDLAGDYPKDFVFDGWHPQCFCYATPIMVDPSEIQKHNEAVARGEEYTPKGKPVTDYPQGFKTWVSGNADRIAAARAKGKMPYFIQNNLAAVDSILNPDEKITGQSLIENIKSKYHHSYIDESVSQDDFEKLTHGLNIDTLVSDVQGIASSRGIDLSRFSIEVQDPNELVLKFSDGKETTELYRTFTRHSDGTLTVNHDVFKIPKDKQAQGFAKDILRRFQEEYDKMGVARINIQAGGDAGGYVWAKYGFMAKNRSQALAAVSDFEHPEWEQFVLDWYAKNGGDKNTPFPMRLIAEQPWGKRALSGKQWEGCIDLNNESQRDAYLSKIGLGGSSREAVPPAPTPQELAIIQELQEAQAGINVTWREEWNGIANGAIGKTPAEQLRNYVDAYEALGLNMQDTAFSRISRTRYTIEEVRRAMDAGKINGSEARSLVRSMRLKFDNLGYHTESAEALWRIKNVDMAAMPADWRAELLPILKRISGKDVDFFSIESNRRDCKFEYANNAAQLAGNELAVKHGLDKLSPKTPFGLFKLFFAKDAKLIAALPDRKFFDNLKEFVRVEEISSGAQCTLTKYGCFVQISTESRFMTVSGLKGVIVHEFGHAYDDLSNADRALRWRADAELRREYDALKKVITPAWRDNANEVMLAARKAIYDKKSPLHLLEEKKDKLDADFGAGSISESEWQRASESILKEMEEAVKKGIQKEFEAAKSEQIAMITEIHATLSDIVEAMSKSHKSLGFGGHGAGYWRKAINLDLAEFIAECSEVRHMDCSILKQAAPEIYDLMVKYGLKYWP